MRQILVFVTMILLLARSDAIASPYSGCGTLINQPFGGCIGLFETLSGGDVYQLSGLGSGGFVTGDVIYIEGDLFSPCATFCSITGCVDVTFVSECIAPISTCGTLVDIGGCILFEEPGGSLYELDALGSFSSGDIVLVDGDLDLSCTPICPDAIGCVIVDSIQLCPGTEPPFQRGDSNDDGAFDISDAIFTLSALFLFGSPQPGCMDAADANDDGGLDISDAVYTLTALFTPGSPPPPDPGPGACGIDPTDDTLGCDVYGGCL